MSFLHMKRVGLTVCIRNHKVQSDLYLLLWLLGREIVQSVLLVAEFLVDKKGCGCVLIVFEISFSLPKRQLTSQK